MYFLFHHNLFLFGFFSAANGKEAVEIAKNNPIDLAIIDLKMPEMNGIDALKRIKKIDRSIEVLVITGSGDLQSLREIIVQEGVFDYLLKPFGLSDIKHSIKRALKRKELNLKKNFASADLAHELKNPLAVISSKPDYQRLWEMKRSLGRFSLISS